MRILIALLLITQAYAAIDLALPADNAMLNNNTTKFEYFPTMDNINECTLHMDEQTFEDATVTSNAFNSYSVLNIEEGPHEWYILCENASTSSTSVTRDLTIDRTPPTVQILGVENHSRVRFRATDKFSPNMSCSFNANTQLVSTVTVQNNTPKTVDLPLAPGNYSVLVSCLDTAGNAKSQSLNMSIPAPPMHISVSTDKGSYALGEKVKLTIEASDDNVTVEVCPDKEGFVECFTPLVDGPGALTLPYANQSGNFIVEAYLRKNGEVVYNQTTYEVKNTLSALFEYDDPLINEPMELAATVTGGIGVINYTWNLSNGVVSHNKSVTLVYDTYGNFEERLTVRDKEGNTYNTSVIVSVPIRFDLTVRVTDATTGKSLNNVSVQVREVHDDTGETRKTANGETVFKLEPESYKVFVSHRGYAYYLQERTFEKAQTLNVALQPEDNQSPVVKITSPEEGAQVTLPVSIAFSVEDAGTTSCTLSYAQANESWLNEHATKEVTSQGSFQIPTLKEDIYRYLIECIDEQGNAGTPGEYSFTVVAENTETKVTEQTTQASSYLGRTDVIDRAYGAYDSFNTDQRALADLLEWSDLIRNEKRTIERTKRDIDALSYRRELSEEEIEQKKLELEKAHNEAANRMPVDISVIEKQTEVQYLKKEDLQAVIKNFLSVNELAMTPEQAVEYLMTVQQDMAPQSEYIRAEIIRADGSRQPISVVKRQIRFKQGIPLEKYSLFELFPPALASEAVLVTGGDQLTPTALEFPAAETVVYYVQNDVSVSELREIDSILFRKPLPEDLVTGNVVISIVDWKTGVLLTLLLLIPWLLYRFHAFQHIKYFVYAESKKKPMHELRTIVNDGLSQLEAGDMDRAMMRYKEAKLSYERLSDYAKNDSYDDLIAFKDALDNTYFNILVDRIKEAMDQGNHIAAIEEYERLEGTFSGLNPEQQDHLIDIVSELGRRLGGAS